MRILLILSTLLMFFSCSRDNEPPIKPDVPRFFQVYLAFIELNQADQARFMDKSALMDSVLTLYDMSPAQFDTTLAYLECHPEIFLQAFEQFNDTLRAKLNIRSVD
jgi:hypothetical protein